MIKFDKQRDKIAIIAPGSGIRDEQGKLDRRKSFERLHTTIEFFKRQGFSCKYDEKIFEGDVLEYFSATKHERLKQLKNAIEDIEVKIIFAFRGGYGSSNIVFDCMDIVPSGDKILIGFSDITVLHFLFNQHYGFPSLHSVMDVTNILMMKEMLNVLAGKSINIKLEPINDACHICEKTSHPHEETCYSHEETCHPRECGDPGALTLDSRLRWNDKGGGNDNEGRGNDKGGGNDSSNSGNDTTKTGYNDKIKGQLLGGNLTLICNMIGTKLHPMTNGKILFMEDIGEACYQIHRKLVHMYNAGLFKNVAAVIFGNFSKTDDDVGSTILEFTKEYLTNIPTYRTNYIGHVDMNYPIIIGQNAEISLDQLSIKSPFKLV